MATGDLTDADVFGAGQAAPAQPSQQGAAGQPAQPLDDFSDIADPAERARLQALPQVEITGHNPSPDQSSPASAKSLSDAAVFGSQTAAPVQTHGDDVLGAEVGMMHPLDNASVWLENGLEKLGVPASDIEHGLGMPSAKDVQNQHTAYLADQAQKGVTPGIAGQVVGGMLPATLTAIATGGGPLVAGALTGALSGDSTSLGGIAKDAALGGVAGKLGDLAISGAQKVISPAIDPYVQKLLDAGVKLTPGQIMGGAAHRIEDSLTSTPVLGDTIRNAQIRGLKSFNSAAINRSLEPIGAMLPGNLPAGRSAIDFAHTALSNAYDEIAPKMTVTADPQLSGDVMKAVQGALPNLTPETKRQLLDIVQSRLLSRFDPATGSMDGATFKDVDSQLGQQTARFSSSPDGNQQNLGDALGDVQDAVRSSAERLNPNVTTSTGASLSDINSGYANLVRVEKAASGVGAKDGMFTAPQLSSAVRAGDSSARKSGYARGNALMQDLSDAGSKVLPSTVPDSGTPLRFLASELPILLGVGAESHVLPLGAAGGAMLGGGVVGGAYTNLGQKIMTPLLTQRPAAAKTVSDLLALAKRPLGNTAASLPALLENYGKPALPASP